MGIIKNRDASGQLFVSIEDVPSSKYTNLRDALCGALQLEAAGEYIEGLNEKCQLFESSEGKISIDWDNWSGFLVTASDEQSEPLLEKVEGWLRENYQ